MAIIADLPVRLTITIDEHGRMNVQGPLENKVLCYGLLEIAREVVQNHKPVERSLVQPTSEWSAVPPDLSR
jgi:hypothetical protein